MEGVGAGAGRFTHGAGGVRAVASWVAAGDRGGLGGARAGALG